MFRGQGQFSLCVANTYPEELHPLLGLIKMNNFCNLK